LAASPVGRKLQSFVQQLETHAIRVVERTWQRATGEAILIAEQTTHRPMNLYEFSRRYRQDAEFREWFTPLAGLLERTGSDGKARQRLLKYGVVTHALTDTLDPNHVITTERDAWPNKLSDSTRKELAYGTFRTHLPFVRNSGRYTGKKKGGP